MVESISWVVILILFPDFRTLPSRMLLTPSSFPISTIGFAGTALHGLTRSLASDALVVLRAGLFRSRPLVRIEAVVPKNDRSRIEAYRRAGFDVEGTLRGVVKNSRKYRDGVIVSAVHDA